MVNNDADDDDATEQCQEEESGSTFDIHSVLLQWKHTTVAVQMTLAPTATHSNALLTISLLTSCYILTVHLYTVHIKNYVAFVKKEDLLFLLLFKTD